MTPNRAETTELLDGIAQLKASRAEAIELLRRAVNDGGDNLWIAEVRQFLAEQGDA